MLASRLKNLRKERDLSQEQLAHIVGTTKGTISNYENSHSTPSNEMLVSLADELQTSTDYLLGRTDDARPLNEFTSTFASMEITPAEEEFLRESLLLLRRVTQNQY